MAYTTIDDPSQYFQTVLYSGNGSTQSITNDGNSDLQPDWLWFKNRNDTQVHQLFDTSRGIANSLRSNSTDAENTDDPNDRLTAINSDGFSLGADGNPNNGSNTYVCWQWKCNGGTTTTNDASATGVGNQDSTHQANTTSGFSIITYSPPSNQVGTMAHGLGAVPHVMIVKCRSTNGERWEVYHHKNTSAPETDHLGLSETDATVDSTHTWNDTAPTSTIFTVGSSGALNEVSKTYVAYLFTEIQGYSKFGKYEGNGSANGPFINTGFKPAWVMIKRTDSSNSWTIRDSKRSTFNVMQKSLFADLTNAEADSSNYDFDFLSNGFKQRNANGIDNANGGTYVYLAFAEYPFVSSKGVPITAR